MSTAATYYPINVDITGISQARNALVTTSSAHYYVVGQLVRFHVPVPYGMYQINEQLGLVLTVPTSNTFTVNVDTKAFSAFNPSPTYPGNMAAQVSPVGDENNTSATTSHNASTVSGAFVNNTA